MDKKFEDQIKKKFIVWFVRVCFSLLKQDSLGLELLTHTRVFDLMFGFNNVFVLMKNDFKTKEASLVLITFSFLMKNDVKTKVFLKEFKNLVS